MDITIAMRNLLAALLVIVNEESQETARKSADRLHDRLAKALAGGNRVAAANEVRAIERFLTQVLSYEEGPGTAAETCADVHDWLLQGGFLPKVADVTDGLPDVVRVTTLADVSGECPFHVTIGFSGCLPDYCLTVDRGDLRSAVEGLALDWIRQEGPSESDVKAWAAKAAADGWNGASLLLGIRPGRYLVVERAAETCEACTCDA